MLRLDNIIKIYEVKDNPVEALKGVSLCFRKNEFVSILGPSGCGKTTLLNILGGLDHYSEGDLIVDGRSTKEFNDRDWDVYRNHRIGFIFQSYNLIPQENILENVELSLTIAGISKEEREKRAIKALDDVGLKGMYKKKPNQLSGGQCQRVAIARALVNEPEILLADEPTGALDSATSVQIMELIKEISKNRLVIMVTHNPELAQRYSSRIISLLDGKVVNDTNPLSPDDELNERSESITTEKEKAKMSWWTAFKLSSKNLLTKMKRTALTVIAASIGIIGVSAVLSVSGGVSGYIESMQDEMLSGNPVTIYKEGFDLSKMMQSASNSQKGEIVQNAVDKDGYINVDFMVKTLINNAKQMGETMISNDITEDYLQFIKEMPKDYYNDISYNYGIDVNNNIYTDDELTGQDKNNSYSLSSLMTVASEIISKTEYSSYASIISSMNNTFSQSLNNEEYLLQQYDIVEGKMAEKENEVMIVLSDKEEITDFTLTLLGYYSQEEFINTIYKFNDDERFDAALFEKSKSISLSDLMSKKFTYYPNDTVYKKNEDSMTSNTRPYFYSYLEDSSWTNGFDLNVVGVLKPKKGRQYESLKSGFYYTPAFTEKYLRDNYDSSISSYIRTYVEENEDSDGLTSGRIQTKNPVTGEMTTMNYGIYYEFPLQYEGVDYKDNIGFVGGSSSMSSMLSILMPGSNSKSCVLTANATGGEKLPLGIDFYPRSFDDKYLVTDYLDRWNSDEDIQLETKLLTKEERDDVDYSDTLEVVISMINTVINMVTIALICFTALALVVSTVMIAIITYVSVMERIKEIGIIRAIGGRKKDVSHLFNAETFIIGSLSGVFGITVTYIIQLILNLIVHSLFPSISSIASLSPLSALIIILISILLTTIAGLIPAHSASKKDPVVALRTE